ATSSAANHQAQAELEEQAEAHPTKRKSSRQQPDLEERPWDGDEPQDRAIRRILEDQYKPLRIKGYKKSIPTPAPLPNRLFDRIDTTPSKAPPKYPWEVKFVGPSTETPLVRTGVQLTRPDRKVDPLKRLELAYGKSYDYRSGFDMMGTPRVLVPDEEGAGRDSGPTRTDGRSRPPVGMRAWNGFVEDKIEQARIDGAFRNIKGRGQPIKEDPARSNPYIKGDDYLINRVIHTQGAAPPWIEIQMGGFILIATSGDRDLLTLAKHSPELESSLSTFRTELRTSWIRRATRMLTLDGASRTAIAEVKNGWRDPEWEARERTYHELSIKTTNSIIRRFNAVAPYSVRRPILVLSRELESCFKDCVKSIENELVRIMEGGSTPPVIAKGRSKGGVKVVNDEEEHEEVKDTMWTAIRRLVKQVVGKEKGVMVDGRQ
ncbi:hypothetical protein P7C70_g3885, partial [Phenoliferia sp. Uapishka_3]